MKRLVLRNFQAPGDLVMLTAAVRDLHRCYPGQFGTDVRSSCPALWENNPWLTPLQEDGAGVQVVDCQYPLIHRSNEVPVHFLWGFIEDLNQRLGLQIRPTEFRGDIHLSEAERRAPSPLMERTGLDVPFWLLVAGGKYDYTAKWWHFRRYQQVVDHFQGRIQFVQVGEAGHYHPTLHGVLDLRGQTTIRELILWMHHAAGVLCPVTFLMHLAAAVPVRADRRGPRPCVVVAGGREPPHWEAYPHHQFIHTVGMLPCCAGGGCWKARTVALGDGDEKDQNLCVDVVDGQPHCLEMIHPEEVIRRVENYFDSGMARALTAKQARQLARSQRPSQRTIVRQHRRGRFQSRPRPEVTVCVLTYGEHFDLAWRCLESVRKFTDPGLYRLVVGANAVGERTTHYLRRLQREGVIERLETSPDNINKCPMMRRMFQGVRTSYLVWLDDDSFLTGPGALEKWIRMARRSPTRTVLWGKAAFCELATDFIDVGDVRAFVRAAAWFRGLPPPAETLEAGGANRWHFILGGGWMARTRALRQLDWPDRRLIKLGDDVLLGEAIRQRGWSFEEVPLEGIEINTQPRRGEVGAIDPPAAALWRKVG